MEEADPRRLLRGRASGLLGSLLLLGYFVVPPVVGLAKSACTGRWICPSKVEDGVYSVLAVAAAICLIAGFLISREVDKQPPNRPIAAATIFALLLAFFAGLLWLMLHAAFW
jgi:chromate transport protein ChrA